MTAKSAPIPLVRESRMLFIKCPVLKATAKTITARKIAATRQNERVLDIKITLDYNFNGSYKIILFEIKDYDRRMSI